MSDVDKDALRKANAAIGFNRIGDGTMPLDYRIDIEPRTGDAWRVMIQDVGQLGDSICHVETIHADTTSSIELLRLALNAYREHRGPVKVHPGPEPSLFDEVAGDD